jgi:RHS repeat-associated protein
MLGEGTTALTYYQAQVKTHADYYPFGMEMEGRTASSLNYRYGFNGKEKDQAGEFSAGQTHYDYGFRIYNPVWGKFLSVDPLTGSYSMLTPYQFASNTPIQAIDLDGLEAKIVTTPKFDHGFAIVSNYNKRPTFIHDDGFLGTYPKIGYVPVPRAPTWQDYAAREKWRGKSALASMKIHLDNAIPAYWHFLDASGNDYHFDLANYLEPHSFGITDKSGVKMLENVERILRVASEDLVKSGEPALIMSRGFQVGDDDKRFPYPSSEDWQKAVGGFSFYVTASVSRTEDGGFYSYSASYTIHAEDRYNFNPSQKDIKTGTPDSDNGRFELTGLAKQFMQYGRYSKNVKWRIKKPDPPATPETPRP